MPRAVPMRTIIPLGILTALLLGVPPTAHAGQLDLLSRIPPRRASDAVGGASGSAALSANGRWTVFFSAAANLSPGQIDDNQGGDVFLYDRISGTVTLVSHTARSDRTAGDQACEYACNRPVISADGRWIAFVSQATDLVPRKLRAGRSNVFLYDRITGATILVSRSLSTRSSGDFSGEPAVSADGRYVAFSSDVTDLVNGQTGTADGVFLYDRVTGKTVLVSRKAGTATQVSDSDSFSPTISADGRYVAFGSFADDLIAGQTAPVSGLVNAFVYDRITQRNVLVSHAAGSPKTGAGLDGAAAVISADGDDIAFLSSASNLVAGQTGEAGSNVFLFHRPTGAVTLISHAAGSPTRAAGGTFGFYVSADGSRVAFYSVAEDLVPGERPAQPPDPALYPTNVFLWERASGAIRLVSHSFGQPLTEGGNYSVLTGLSADGERVLFSSAAPDLVGPGDPASPSVANFFLYDRGSDRTVLVSHAGADGDLGGNGDSLEGALSADGSWVAFSSQATDLAPDRRDLNQATDIYLWGRSTGERELVSRRDPGLPSATPQARSGAGDLSADGRYAAFVSGSTQLVPGARDANGVADVFLYDRTLRKTILVSHAAASSAQAGNRKSADPSISADGRFVAYLSVATDLVPGQAEGGNATGFDVFLFDRVTGETTLVSRSADSAVTTTGQVSYARISADGSTVAFESLALDLVPGQVDTGFHVTNVFAYERAAGTVALLSHAEGHPARPGDHYSFFESLSADGRSVVISSRARDLLTGVQPTQPGDRALYLYDRVTGKPALISHATVMYPHLGVSAEISADGRFVAFQSYLHDLVPGQAGDLHSIDVYLYDRLAGTTRWVSHAPGASTTPELSGEEPPAISGDGSFVVYAARPPGAQHRNIFLFDRISGQVQLVSAGTQGEEANGSCSRPRIAADGRYIAFASQATNLTADPITAIGSPPIAPINIYLYDRVTMTMTLVSRSFRPPGGGGNRDSTGLVLSGTGGFVLLDSLASNLVPGDFNGGPDGSLSDVFLYSPLP